MFVCTNVPHCRDPYVTSYSKIAIADMYTLSVDRSDVTFASTAYDSNIPCDLTAALGSAGSCSSSVQGYGYSNIDLTATANLQINTGASTFGCSGWPNDGYVGSNGLAYYSGSRVAGVTGGAYCGSCSFDELRLELTSTRRRRRRNLRGEPFETPEALPLSMLAGSAREFGTAERSEPEIREAATSPPLPPQIRSVTTTITTRRMATNNNNATNATNATPAPTPAPSTAAPSALPTPRPTSPPEVQLLAEFSVAFFTHSDGANGANVPAA